MSRLKVDNREEDSSVAAEEFQFLIALVSKKFWSSEDNVVNMGEKEKKIDTNI